MTLGSVPLTAMGLFQFLGAEAFQVFDAVDLLVEGSLAVGHCEADQS
jgi:hypothetical protein